MEGVITAVVDVVERGVTDSRALIATGREEVTTYVDGLPDALRQVGQEAAGQMQAQFSALEASVTAKEGELVDSLARRYTEQVSELDSRVEELRAEHQSFAATAWDATVGVARTVMKLKDLLLSVLSRAAGVVVDIVRHPIRFLDTMVEGVKTESAPSSTASPGTWRTLSRRSCSVSSPATSTCPTSSTRRGSSTWHCRSSG